MHPRLYLDNAATSFPKPPEVLEAMRQYAETLGASAGRGAYLEATQTGELLAKCRRLLAKLINCPLAEHIVFTSNCTAALNQAIKGWVREGDHVVATAVEHNSVLRPLHAMVESRRLQLTIVPADPQSGQLDPSDVAAAIRSETRLVCVVHASNVTGALQPIDEVAKITAAKGICLLVDAAQSAGHIPIDVQKCPIDLLAMPGHKGLMGPLGTGALFIRPGLENRLAPLIEGGTGSVSEVPVQPAFMPDRFESGSHNAIGLAGLAASLKWLDHKSIEEMRSHELSVIERFLDRTSGIEGLTIFGPRVATDRVGVFSVRVGDLEPAELSALLEAEFGILTRSGLHCAPLAHEAIGTHDRGGTTRISFGAFNTTADVDRCVAALEKLVAAGACA